MLDQLTKLATEKSSEKRLELMNVITNMFIDNTQENSQTELELFGDVFTKLLSEMDEDGKAEISQKFAQLTKTPKTFAIALIYENADVAAPMLEHSKVFDDDDLINAAKMVTTEHRIAIAKRRFVSAVVTDNLIGYGETTVLHTIFSNETAHISGEGFNHIVENHAEDGELLALLLMRPDLPKAVKAILPTLAGGILPKVKRVSDSHTKEQMQKLMQRTQQQREATQKSQAAVDVSTLAEVNQVKLDDGLKQQAQ